MILLVKKVVLCVIILGYFVLLKGEMDSGIEEFFSNFCLIIKLKFGLWIMVVVRLYF